MIAAKWMSVNTYKKIARSAPPGVNGFNAAALPGYTGRQARCRGGVGFVLGFVACIAQTLKGFSLAKSLYFLRKSYIN